MAALLAAVEHHGANTQQHGWPAVTGAFFQVVDRAEAWEAAARSAAATSRWARAYRTWPSGSVSLAADWMSSSPLPRHHHHRAPHRAITRGDRQAPGLWQPRTTSASL